VSIHLTDVGSVYFEKETVQGSVVAPALVPAEDVFDDSGISIPFDMAEVLEGEPELAPRNEMRKTRGKRKPDAIGPRVGGAKKMRRSGSLSLTLRLEGVGDGDSDAYPLTWLLNTLLEDTGAPAELSDELQAYHDPAPAGTDADAFHCEIDRFVCGVEKGLALGSGVEEDAPAVTASSAAPAASRRATLDNMAELAAAGYGPPKHAPGHWHFPATNPASRLS